MSEDHAQNVARGHKANISNPNTGEESKERSRQILEKIEGSSDPSDFTASVGSEKPSQFSSERATEAVDELEKSKQRTNEPSKLYPDGLDKDYE